MPIRKSKLLPYLTFLFSLRRLVDGEGAARYIKTTNNKNATTPIIAVSAYGGSEPPTEQNNLFAAYIQKPVQKADLLTVMRQLGFKTSTAPSRGPAASRVTAGSVTAAPAPVAAAGLSTPAPIAPSPVSSSAAVTAR